MPPAEDYKQHWDKKFQNQEWGRYPPEDLVRFMGRFYRNTDRKNISVLEIGCGPGANIWFLHREGYRVSGIDGSPTAIDLANKRILVENAGLKAQTMDLRAGDFSTLPWKNESFDVVIDIFSLYANRLAVIEKTISEIYRVLKPGGRFYSKTWGRGTAGYGSGDQLEAGTFDNILSGPCANMGMSHFFDEPEIRSVFRSFRIDAIDRVIRSDNLRSTDTIEEYHSVMTKTV
jgi:SAM-dependent methyltransferase